MKSGETILAFVLLAVLGGLGYGGYWLYEALTRGALVENLGPLAARTEEAARAGRLTAPLKSAIARQTDGANFAGNVRHFFSGPKLPVFTGADLYPALPWPVAVVDLNAGRYDAIADRLPGSARARTIQDARTVVFVRCMKQKSGQYGYVFVNHAYSMACSELAIDMKAPAGPTIVGVNSAENAPPDRISSRTWGDVVAERPFGATDFVLTGAQKAGGAQGPKP